MKIYFARPESRAVGRVITNLERYLPAGNTIVPDMDEADLVVLHVAGKNIHTTEAAQRILAQGKQYAVIQYAFLTTRNKDPNDWKKLWDGAKVVWSYYDLSAYITRFYHAPIAADQDLFFRTNDEKKYTVGTLGDDGSYRIECFGEVHLAAFQVGGNVAHVGNLIGTYSNVDRLANISDDELRTFYNRCNWFSALRRVEGFEMGVVESLLCGTRPIVFDNPNYRRWFDGLVKFISEKSVGNILSELRNVLRETPQPVTDEEIEEVKRRFDWNKIITGFWERCTT